MSFAFSDNPAFGPIPTAGAWIYSGIVQTGTTTNSSTALTGLTMGTSFMAVGQPISGLNILPNTTITVIVSATAVTLSQATSSSGAGTGNITIGQNPQAQSAFSFGSPYGVPSSALTPVTGCDFAIPETQTIVFNAAPTALAGTFIPAPGQGVMSLASGATTGMSIQYQTAAGVWTTIYTGTAAATSNFEVVCDGGNVRVTSPGTTNGTFTFYRLLRRPQS